MPYILIWFRRTETVSRVNSNKYIKGPYLYWTIQLSQRWDNSFLCIPPKILYPSFYILSPQNNPSLSTLFGLCYWSSAVICFIFHVKSNIHVFNMIYENNTSPYILIWFRTTERSQSCELK